MKGRVESGRKTWKLGKMREVRTRRGLWRGRKMGKDEVYGKKRK